VAAAFRVQVITNKNTGSSAPVRSIEGNTFLYTRHKDIFLVAVTRSNANSIMVFRFLYAMVDVLKGYFGPDFDEESLRDNFTLVYELLDGTLQCALKETNHFLSFVYVHV
jgi:AP-2 complex subunit mu-1